MKLSDARHFLYLCLIAAFLLSGISPVCQWVSGKVSLIEICSTDGLKTIAVPLEISPGNPQQQNHDKKPDCLFCFALAKVKTTGPVATITFDRQDSSVFFAALPAGIPLFTSQFPLNFGPRGPPVIS